jgi:NAD(P)H-dependent FMN reductase
MFIPIILGTARKQRQSEKAAKFILEEAKKYGFESEIIDVKDYLIGATDNKKTTEISKKYCDIISKSGGFVIVSPEYNHGYPGELKLLLDMAYQEYAKKPVGICGVSNGMLGGARMVEQLRQVAVGLLMVPITKALYFSLIQDLFDNNGEIKDKTYIDRLKTFFAELELYAKTLKKAKK